MNKQDLLSDEQFFCILGDLLGDDPSVSSFDTEFDIGKSRFKLQIRVYFPTLPQFLVVNSVSPDCDVSPSNTLK
jgi:hypothetical protein